MIYANTQIITEFIMFCVYYAEIVLVLVFGWLPILTGMAEFLRYIIISSTMNNKEHHMIQ